MPPSELAIGRVCLPDLLCRRGETLARLGERVDLRVRWRVLPPHAVAARVVRRRGRRPPSGPESTRDSVGRARGDLHQGGRALQPARRYGEWTTTSTVATEPMAATTVIRLSRRIRVCVSFPGRCMRRGWCCPMGTGGGLTVDVRSRVQREDGESIPGMYTVGNTPADTFGRCYPGAGAAIGHRLVFADIAARDMAERTWHCTDGHWSPARSSGRNLRRRRSAHGRLRDGPSEGGTHCVKPPRRALMRAGRALTID